MLAQLIRRHNALPNRAAVVSPLGAVNWGQLANHCDLALAKLRAAQRQRVGLVMHPAPSALACLAALDQLCCDVLLLNPALGARGWRAIGEQFKLSVLVDHQGDHFGLSVEIHRLHCLEPSTGKSTVTIVTSGTTGVPKAVRHTWETLFRPVRTAVHSDPPTWLLTYAPHLYAGLQVMCQCLADYGTLVMPNPQASMNDIAKLIVEHGVMFASGTPSYWRRLVLFADRSLLKQAALRQITLGGEVVDQTVLDLLKDRFPSARLVHIYATTELGRCFSVTDGHAGFPSRFLNVTSPDGITLRIENGQLMVQSANAMCGYDHYGGQQGNHSDWFATGDLVRKQDGRVFFVGRQSDVINVGGNKVHPLEVEQHVRSVAGVSDARVYAKASSIAGELVACQIVVDPAYDAFRVRGEVVRHCIENLTSYQRPRFVDVVEQLCLSQASKIIRKDRR